MDRCTDLGLLIRVVANLGGEKKHALFGRRRGMCNLRLLTCTVPQAKRALVFGVTVLYEARVSEVDTAEQDEEPHLLFARNVWAQCAKANHRCLACKTFISLGDMKLMSLGLHALDRLGFAKREECEGRRWKRKDP